jgi:hypothetical protein
MTWPALTAAFDSFNTPVAGNVTTVTLTNAVPSVSLYFDVKSVAWNTTVVSSVPLTPIPANTGASFTAVIVIETVAATESAVPSFTWNVNESLPVAFAFGVYVRFGAVPLNTPFDGCVTTV